MMVDMGLDKIVHHDREPCHDRILNAWIKYWESYILRTRYQDNEKNLIKKYKNTSFLDDEENQTYMIPPENLEFKGPTKINKQYCVVGQSLYWRYGYNVDLLIPRDTNGDLMVPIKGVEQDPDLGVKIIHPS